MAQCCFRLPQQPPICRYDKAVLTSTRNNFCDANSNVHAPSDMEIPGRTIQLLGS